MEPEDPRFVIFVELLIHFHFALGSCKWQCGSEKNYESFQVDESSTELRSCDFCCGDLASRDTSEEPQELQEIECYKVEAAIEPQFNTNVYTFLFSTFLYFFNYSPTLLLDKNKTHQKTEKKWLIYSKSLNITSTLLVPIPKSFKAIISEFQFDI